MWGRGPSPVLSSRARQKLHIAAQPFALPAQLHVRPGPLWADVSSHDLGRGRPGYVLPLLRQDLADAPDLRPHSAQFFFNVLIAAVNVIDAVNDGFALGHQRSQDQRS